MSRRPPQIQREQLTDREWSAMCRLFEAVERIAAKLEGRKDQPSHPLA